ncbi:MAG: hypothetical protein NTU53_23090 [Planctomycetota bacterium]|nr:hypothetical protein [Planctomycetota bacterium]
MIYSKFGTQLTLVSKHQDADGRLTIQGTAGDTADIREYHVRDLKADEGSSEIDATVAKLPWKVVEKKAKPGQRNRS